MRKFEGLSASSPSGTSLRETLILFNAGIPLGEIASTKGVKIGTVHSHIAQLIEGGLITTFGTFISRREYEDVVAELQQHPDTAYDTLKERYPSGIIAIARAIGRVKGVLQ
ncbi:MAG: helix-turn-helix domain-containing protein [Muribaculaceae bacterium]|nr:helix-turn-helix domain-containing protein [Muribaculaceae bacterium]